MGMEGIETITVDSYTTLVDVGSQADVLDAHIPELVDSGGVSRTWRHQYLLYSVIANDIDAYRPFWELIGLGLEYALEAHGYDVPRATQDRIRKEVYHDNLAVFDDVQAGIERLTTHGYPVFVLSNGDPEMLSRLVETAGLTDLVAGTISAAEVQTYKPDPGIYEHAATRTDTPIDRILHVSGGGLRDVWGAKHAGMHTAWLRRPAQTAPTERLGPDPDITLPDFHALADTLT